MKIVSLESQNVKRLTAVEITPDGHLVVIGGKNGQGKTSVLDSIAYALGGQGAVCSKPIHRGAKKAKVICKMDDMVVTRTFTEGGGGTLSVTNADGTAKFSSPQKILDSLVGRLSFDPLAFLHMKPPDQLATLKGVVGLDLSELDGKRKAAYDARTVLGRDLRSKEAQVDAIVVTADVPAAEVEMSKLVAQLDAAVNHNQNVDEMAGRVMVAEREIATLELHAKGLREELARLSKRLEDGDAMIARQKKALAVAKKAAESVERVDTAPIKAAMSEAETVNRKVREKLKRVALLAEHSALAKQYAGLSESIEKIDAAKEAALAAAQFPIDGLGFGEDGVMFKGLPFDQSSSAEQLRVSVGMGLAANPKLKVLLVRDGSLLDADSLALVAKMAEEADAQIWLEKVSTEAGECQVIIEDGHVRGVEPKEEDADDAGKDQA